MAQVVTIGTFTFQGWPSVSSHTTDADEWTSSISHVTMEMNMDHPSPTRVFVCGSTMTSTTPMTSDPVDQSYTWTQLTHDMGIFHQAVSSFIRSSPWHGTSFQTGARLVNLDKQAQLVVRQVAYPSSNETDDPITWLDQTLYRILPSNLFTQLLTKKKGAHERRQLEAEQKYKVMMDAYQTLVNRASVFEL